MFPSIQSLVKTKKSIIYLLIEKKKHLKAVWRNMRKKGFLMLTNTNEFASKALKMLFALPLLPAGDIQRGFDMVGAFAVNHGVPMGSLFDYYQK